MERTSTRAEPFNLEINGRGTVNGVSFSAEGSGQGDPRQGNLSFEVVFSDVSEGTDAFANVLALLILATGLFGRELGRAVNLLTLANGEFSFRQVVTGSAISAQSSGTLSRIGDHRFTWSSVAEGEVALANVTAIEPARVVMLPAGLGRLIETIDWSIVDGDAVKHANAVRHFTFAPTVELTRLQIRDVSIEPHVTDRSVRLDIVSSIRDFPVPQGEAR